MKRRYFDLPVGLTDQRLGISPPNHHNTQYTYDKNGNLTKDLNKNISSIQYNFLNLPANITYSSGKSAAYIYDANGQKLRTSYKASASATAVPTDYCGNMIYENGVLKQVLVDGGYMTVTGTPFYFYFLKDHLGSNRVVVTPAGTAMQVNHYYPFGGLFGESTGGTSQRFKYNGKEFDRTHGVDWYDYGARHMPPDAGRFTTIDPMAEKYYNISPYAYCTDNPINAIDAEGKWVWPLVNAAIDYGFQVYDNYNTGMGSYDAFVGNVNFARVGLSAIPLGKVKTAGTLLVEGAKEAISWMPNRGFQMKEDVQTITRKAVANTIIDKGVGKLVEKSSANSLKQAKQDTRSANKTVVTAENKARQNPKSTKRQASVTSAKKKLQQAREEEVRTEMLHFTIGHFNSDAFDTFITSGFQRITDLLNGEE